jgi:DNA-directed RNA polymerase subunit RPC12/RpoP
MIRNGKKEAVMELVEVITKAREGTLRCPKCGSEGVSLQNVRIGMEAGKPKVDPNTYGLCKKCGSKIAIEELQNVGDGVARKPWWQLWK